MTDAFERAILTSSINALRRRAEALRKRASIGVVVLDCYRRPVLVITSESATAFKIAKSWDAVASDLEAEGSP